MNLVALAPAVPAAAIIFLGRFASAVPAAAIFSLGRFASAVPAAAIIFLGSFASNAAEELPMRSGMDLCDRRA